MKEPPKLHECPNVVRLWLTGQRPFVLAAREQDLDAILESTFSVDTLIEFYGTQGALLERRFWIAFALWRSMGLRIDPDECGDYDAAETDRLKAFISVNLKEFKSLGLGTDAECPLVRYIANEA